MSTSTDSNVALRALIVLGLIGFATYVAADRGLLALLLRSDQSYISYLILGLYVLASLHWLWLAYQLGEERRRFGQLEHELSEGESDLSRYEIGLVGSFMRNWREKGGRGDASALLTAFGDELVNRHAFGHFASDALLKLGLLGTVVGFILMLLPVAELSEFSASLMQQLLRSMSGGMAVALYTTLAGLVTSTLLRLQYHILDASAADLATRLSVLTDVRLGKPPSPHAP
ncbi:MAG: hypothetical protein HKP27_03935 [Myxococcales bacterium]|nr:hypothetical protein [Myxococcales bacterium]